MAGGHVVVTDPPIFRPWPQQQVDTEGQGAQLGSGRKPLCQQGQASLGEHRSSFQRRGRNPGRDIDAPRRPLLALRPHRKV